LMGRIFLDVHIGLETVEAAGYPMAKKMPDPFDGMVVCHVSLLLSRRGYDGPNYSL
jgi:hypothetical protein